LFAGCAGFQRLIAWLKLGLRVVELATTLAAPIMTNRGSIFLNPSQCLQNTQGRGRVGSQVKPSDPAPVLVN